MSAKSLMGMINADDSGGGWIVTFADMMILVFFILLYTLATVRLPNEDTRFAKKLKIRQNHSR